MRAYIEQHKSIDRSLKLVNDCVQRNYLQSCSDESARYLLYVTSVITHLCYDDRIYSEENLSAHNAMIKICQAKSIYDQSYDDMKENYIEIENHLREHPPVHRETT